MQMIAAVIVMTALMTAALFSGGGFTPSRLIPFDYRSDNSLWQAETYARAAFIARTTTPGALPRASLPLPAGFSDNPTYPITAYSDGVYIYVWTANPDVMAQRLRPFAALSTIDVQVGLSSAATIAWRDGSSSAKPAVVSYPSAVVRFRAS